jgi:hypothetical protein
VVVTDVALYHHLMSYQSPGATTARPDPLTEHLEWPSTNQEWISLTRKHLQSHEAQRQQWLHSLSTLATTLEQVESSLSLAKRTLNEHIEAADNHFRHSPPSHSDKTGNENKKTEL